MRPGSFDGTVYFSKEKRRGRQRSPRAEERSLSLGRTESLRTATVEGSWRVRARGLDLDRLGDT